MNPADPAWLVIYSTIGYERLSRLVPRFIFDRIKLTISGWEFHARYDMIERLGKDFVLVTPGSVIVYITDPSLAVGVFKHAKEFGRNETAQKILGVFGQNLISVSLLVLTSSSRQCQQFDLPELCPSNAAI